MSDVSTVHTSKQSSSQLGVNFMVQNEFRDRGPYCSVSFFSDKQNTQKGGGSPADRSFLLPLQEGTRSTTWNMAGDQDRGQRKSWHPVHGDEGRYANIHQSVNIGQHRLTEPERHTPRHRHYAIMIRVWFFPPHWDKNVVCLGFFLFCCSISNGLLMWQTGSL